VSTPQAATLALPTAGVAPHLRSLMADYAATGLPPAYLPKESPSSRLTEIEIDLDDARSDDPADRDGDGHDTEEKKP
jgi:hypothetical protein